MRMLCTILYCLPFDRVELFRDEMTTFPDMGAAAEKSALTRARSLERAWLDRMHRTVRMAYAGQIDGTRTQSATCRLCEAGTWPEEGYSLRGRHKMAQVRVCAGQESAWCRNPGPSETRHAASGGV